MGVLVKNGKSYTGTGDLLIQPVIYSDDERCIGVWRDGKPLYRKTFVLSSRTLVDNTWRTILPSSSISDLNIEYITACDSYDNNSDSNPLYNFVCTYPLATLIDSNGVRAYFNSSTKITALTLQYTKTTDTAGTAAWVPTGATPIHYSLNEQVIGTWIDGKPLYQKTLNLTSPASNTDAIIADLTSLNISTMVSIDGLIHSLTVNQFVPIFWSHSSSLMGAVYYAESEKKLRQRIMGDYANQPEYVTIQYTKTTD